MAVTAMSLLVSFVVWQDMRRGEDSLGEVTVIDVSVSEVAAVKEEVATDRKKIDDEQVILNEKYGDYVQVTSDGKVLTKNGEVSEVDFKAKVPSNTEIHVYDGPQGKGYQTITKIATATISIGFGPEGADRTYTITFPEPVASNTKEIP